MRSENYHQHPLSTTLVACTLTFTPLMWLLLIQIQLLSTPTIYNTRGVYTNLYPTDVVTYNQYHYHQHPLSTTLAACTLTFTPPMWLLLIQLPSTPTIYNTRGVYTNLYTTDVVTSNQYNYHQHSLSTTLAACTLTCTPLMWLLLINITIINTHYLQHSWRVH